MTVGRLARRSGLTAKALRHYDRVGLLSPSAVDPATGYRYYAPEQVEQARLIGVLRAVDLPLEQIRAVLADRSALADLLAAHRRRLRSRLDRITGDLHRVDHLLQDGVPMTETSTTTAPTDERKIAVDLFNAVWRLMEKEGRSAADDDQMIHMAHASRYHWGNVGTAVNLSRGEWQISRVYAVLERAEPALFHARRDLALCQENGIGDWDLAYAYEALARAAAVAGDAAGARSWTEQALAAAEDIAESEDRELLLTDLETIPGQPRFW